MKLYEINAEIQALSDAIDFDPETGELFGDAEEIWQKISDLQMEKRTILIWIAKLVLNLKSEGAALKAEEMRLKGRRERLSKKEERFLGILDRECQREMTELGVATFTYRKTSHVEVTDSAKAVRWLKRHKFEPVDHVPHMNLLYINWTFSEYPEYSSLRQHPCFQIQSTVY